MRAYVCVCVHVSAISMEDSTISSILFATHDGHMKHFLFLAPASNYN